MIRIGSLLLLVFLSGCYETVSERSAREDMDERMRYLERQADKPCTCEQKK